jgi:hypothetical protein
MMINIALKSDKQCQVYEIQIVHSSLLHTRKSLPGHVIYARVRNAIETLEFMLVPSVYEERGEDCARRLMATAPSTPQQLSLMGFSKECISAGELIANGRDTESLAAVGLEVAWLAQACTQTVILSNCDLAESVGHVLGRLISDSVLVAVLNLSNNKLGVGAAKDIARALERNSTIVSLDLSGNVLGPDGGSALSLGLEKSSTLSQVNYNR